MKSYFVGGVNASGKSTFVKTLCLGQAGWHPVSGSQELMSWLKLLPGDYQSLRKLPRAFTVSSYSSLVRDLIERKRAGNNTNALVFNSHYLDLVEGYSYATIDEECWNEFDGLVLLTAAIETILHRIEKDERARGLFPPAATLDEKKGILQEHIAKSRDLFETMADRYGIPKLVITNEDGELEDAVAKFNKFHHGSISW